MSKDPFPSVEQLLESLGPSELLRPAKTNEAAKILRLSPETLSTYRSRGGEPRFCRPEGSRHVFYLVVELFRWLFSGGLKSNTRDPGTPVRMPAFAQPANDNGLLPAGKPRVKQ